MSSSVVETREALAVHVEVSEDTLSMELADGRTIAAPLAWYPRLLHGSAEEWESWRLLGGGASIGRRWTRTSVSPTCWPASRRPRAKARSRSG
jgi:hypothetical protein